VLQEPVLLAAAAVTFAAHSHLTAGATASAAEADVNSIYHNRQ
jgi:hypothetical protein